MDNNQIKYLVETIGIGNIKQPQLFNSYKFITGHQLKSSCGECGRRKAIKKLLEYYNEIK